MCADALIKGALELEAADVEQLHFRERKKVLVTPDNHHEVTDAMVSAVVSDPNLFALGGGIVEVRHDTDGRTVIGHLTPAVLEQRVNRHLTFYRIQRDRGEPTEVAIPPPRHCVRAVHESGYWPGAREIRGLAPHPILRADGSVFNDVGFDAKTQWFCTSSSRFWDGSVSREQALVAMADLVDLVRETPFAQPWDLSGWLAAVLTSIARPIIDIAPFFLFGSPNQSAGKTTLAQLVARITTGQNARIGPTGKEEEQQKTLLALAREGARVILFDNIVSRFGNATVAATITSESFDGRILRESRTEGLIPVAWTLLGTGNNVQLHDDLVRRVVLVSLQSQEENCEEKRFVVHPDILRHATERRNRYQADALTILSWHLQAAKSEPLHVDPLGFHVWANVVRGALLRLGCADPADGRHELRVVANPMRDAVIALLAVWMTYRDGLTVAEALEMAREQSCKGGSKGEYTHRELRHAILAVAGGRDSSLPGAQMLGDKLSREKRRLYRVGQQLVCFDVIHQRHGGANVWGVLPADQCRIGKGDAAK